MTSTFGHVLPLWPGTQLSSLCIQLHMKGSMCLPEVMHLVNTVGPSSLVSRWLCMMGLSVLGSGTRRVRSQRGVLKAVPSSLGGFFPEMSPPSLM